MTAAPPVIPPSTLEERLKRALVPPRWELARITAREKRKGEPGLRLLPFLVDPGRAAFDIGANRGIWAGEMAKLTQTVWAFEPNPKLFAVLERAAPAGVDCRYLALSDAPGEARLLIPGEAGRYSNQGASLNPAKVEGEPFMEVVVEAARLDDLDAGRGEVLLLQPWGEPPRKAIFEAATLAGFANGIDPGLDEALSRLTRSQNIKLFFGRYTRTAFDLQQPGGAEHEQQRSRAVGDEMITAIRYSGDTDQLEIERQVVTRFVEAMNRGDVEAAAALLDPSRYGGDAMDGLGAQARMATASLLARDWREVDHAAMSPSADRVWEGAGVRLELIITGDFIYITAVSTD